MAQSRQCPTRVDGADPLIAHSISIPVCAKRQREHYHKCYTCVHAQAEAAPARTPRRPALPDPPGPVELGAEGAA